MPLEEQRKRGTPHPFAASDRGFPCPIPKHVDSWLVPMNGRIMGLLAAGIPLTLLADLVEPPDSCEILMEEGPRSFPA